MYIFTYAYLTLWLQTCGIQALFKAVIVILRAHLYLANWDTHEDYLYIWDNQYHDTMHYRLALYNGQADWSGMEWNGLLDQTCK